MKLAKNTKEYNFAINLLGMRKITRFSQDNDYLGKEVATIDKSTIDSGKINYDPATGFYKLVSGETFYEWRT